MTSSGDDDNPTIRQYLLGRLSDEDREHFARRFFTDEELFDNLQAAEDDLIDDFLSGNLSQDDVDMFHRNFLIGSKRERGLRIGKAWRNYAAAHAGDKPPKPVPITRWWQIFPPYALKMATSAAVVVIAAVVVWQIMPSKVDEGLYALNAAYQKERPLESRITGLGYAPYDPNVTRGPGSAKVGDQNELLQAEAKLSEAVNKKPTPKAHHALGKVYLAKEEFDKAIEQFQEALKGNPSDAAQVYADLGAALFEKGKLAGSGKGVDDFALSLKNLDKALELDNDLLEALYNRALLQEAMGGLLPQAEADWRRYIALDNDPNSKWAAEARERLANVEGEIKKTSETRKEIFERFLNQFNSGDEEGAWVTVSSYQNRTGNVVAEQLIDAYLEAASQSRKEDAGQAILRLKYVGDLQIKKSEDRFFFDLARFYESANPEQRELVLKARELMKKGYAGWGQQYDENLSFFQNARELFEQAQDYPEARVAEYWMSFCHYHKDRLEQSRQILDPLLFDSERRHYLWFQVRALYLLSSLEFKENEHSKAVDSSLRSHELAKHINDAVGQLNAATALIEYYRYLGDYEKSLTWIQRSLPLTASSLDPFQGLRHYSLVASAFATMGLPDAAAAYQREAWPFALKTGSDGARLQQYIYLGAIEGKLRNSDEALRNVQLAFDLAQSLGQDGNMAYSALQMGDIYKDAGDFDNAVARYTQAIDIYNKFKNFQTHLYQAHKGRFWCYLQQQKDKSTQAEISILFDLINKYRKQISDEGSRNTFFDVEQRVVDAAIDFQYSKMKNPEQAFNYSNLSRARSLLDLLKADAARVQDSDIKFQAVSEPRSLETIKEQLPEKTQLVQYIVLENKLLICVISGNDYQVRMQPISWEDLDGKLRRFLNLISKPPNDEESQELMLAKELYAILIQPVETLLDKRKLLCIIPDRTLSYLPFAALVSPESGRYLFEDHRLMTSPSASVFLSCSENALQKIGSKEEKVLSVGNPTFDRAAFPDFDDLPQAGREALEVSKLYKSRVPPLIENLATRTAVKRDIESSEVIHFALHSIVDDQIPLRSKLLLAKTDVLESDSVIYAHEIYNLKLSHTRLVVLSSCQSGAGRYYGGEGVNSLARAFISAGVPLVVASLWPVESGATEMLMVNFHSHRTQDHFSTVAALREAQQQMARGPVEKLRRPYYWAAFTVTGGYAEF